MNPLISLVIPVYNVEKYLRKCLDSVLAQTYDNFEVILVDDGSTDNSGNICDEYAEKDKRIIVYHQPNSGVCRARNFGIENSKGEFISFIDSDDQISEKYLEILVKTQSEKNYDFTLCEFTNINEDTGKVDRRISYDGNCEFFADDIDSNVTSKTLVNSNKQIIGNPVCKLFRRKIITDNNIKYCEKIHLHEDRMFNYEYCKHICSFVYAADSLYTRHIRSDSAMNIYRENTLAEFENICKEYVRILNKYKAIGQEEIFYSTELTVSDVLPRYVCNKINNKPHNVRWKEYYNFLENDPVNKIWGIAKSGKALPIKYKIIIILIKLHMTYLIEWVYSIYKAIRSEK